jgi:hypothetical protein
MATFGVTLISPSGVVVESLDVEHKADFKQLIDSGGHHYEARTYDTTYPFSARGKGANPYAVGVMSGSAPGSISGKTFITSVKNNTKNDDWVGWEITGIAYSHA